VLSFLSVTFWTLGFIIWILQVLLSAHLRM
jgi:hypothetical protein